MSKRKSVRLAVRFVVLGTALGALAAYSLHSKPWVPALAAGFGEAAATQVSNRQAKTNRLALLVPTSLTVTDSAQAFALASSPTTPDLDRFDNAFALATPETETPDAIPGKQEPAPSVAPAGPKHAALTPPFREPAPLPPQKPKPHPQAASATSGILDDTQIAGLKGRLRLTSDQVDYWPAVEAALREVVRTQLRGHHAMHGKPNIDVNSPEVQKLIWAAMPLLMRLREDQKGEVRKLARVMGLEQVASQI